MNDFWNNIYRYPTFFVSSVIGLILVILTPFRNIFKIKKFKLALILLSLLIISIIYFIIITMTGIQ